MRAREILEENYNQSLLSDLNNILTVAKSCGSSELNTADIVNQLRSMGYAVDENSIITLLDGNPMIANSSSETINLVPPIGAQNTGGGNATQDTAAQVSDMAQKATKIG